MSSNANHIEDEDEKLPMSEEGFESVLEEMITSYPDPIYTDDGNTNANVAFVRDFRGAGVLTRNKGLVVTLADGSEFQLTIVKSR